MSKGRNHSDGEAREEAPRGSSPPPDAEGSILFPIGEEGRRRTPRDADSDAIATLRPGQPEPTSQPTGDPEITFRKPRIARGSQAPTDRLPLQAPRDDDTEVDPRVPALSAPPAQDTTSRLALERRPRGSRALVALLMLSIAAVVAAIALRLLG